MSGNSYLFIGEIRSLDQVAKAIDFQPNGIFCQIEPNSNNELVLKSYPEDKLDYIIKIIGYLPMYIQIEQEIDDKLVDQLVKWSYASTIYFCSTNIEILKILFCKNSLLKLGLIGKWPDKSQATMLNFLVLNPGMIDSDIGGLITKDHKRNFPDLDLYLYNVISLELLHKSVGWGFTGSFIKLDKKLFCHK